MTEISQELRQILDDVCRRFEENGITEYVLIVRYEDKDVISTKMTPQRTLLYLIDSLGSTKEQCLRQAQQSSEKQNN